MDTNSLFFLSNAIYCAEVADEFVIWADYQRLCYELNVTPFGLGMLAFYRAITQALFSPVAVSAFLSYKKVTLIGFGSLWCGVFTLLASMSSEYWSVALCRIISGIGSSFTTPAIQAVLADSNKEQDRGVIYGWLFGSGFIGMILSTFSTAIFSSNLLISFSGWQITRYIFGMMWIACGISVLILTEDMPDTIRIKSSGGIKTPEKGHKLSNHVKEILVQFFQVLRIRSFQVVTIQGVISQIPTFSLLLLPFWLQFCGHSTTLSTVLVSILHFGAVFGSVFGGLVGDIACQKNPTVGRILCAQFSAGVTIPLCALLLEGFSKPAIHSLLFGLMFFFMGFCSFWVPSACSFPILSEVVPYKLRTTVFSLNQAVQKSFYGIVAPYVGFLAERLQREVKEMYADRLGDEEIVSVDDADESAKNLFLAIGFPSFVSVVLIFGLYWTYSNDRDRARVESWVDQSLELNELETDSETSLARRETQIEMEWASDEDLTIFEESGSQSPPVSIEVLEARAASQKD